MASLSLKESKRIFDFNFLKHPNVCRRFVIYAKSALSRFTNSTFLSVEQKLQICCMPPILNHINSRSMQSILDLQFATCQQEVTDRRERTRKGDQRAMRFLGKVFSIILLSSFICRTFLRFFIHLLQIPSRLSVF